MNQTTTPREKTILTAVGIILLLALMSSMTSCSPRVTECHIVQTHMVGYR